MAVSKGPNSFLALFIARFDGLRTLNREYCYENLAQKYENKGKYLQALYYYKKANASKDKIDEIVEKLKQ